MENEARSGSQKRIFRKAARTLFVPVDYVPCISRPYFAYEKCSPDIGDSNDMKKSDIRRINRNICKEKPNFIDFWKMIPRFVRSESHSFWHPHPKTPLRGYFACLQKFFEDSNQKSASKDLSEMFPGLFWYVSRGHTTNIGFCFWEKPKKKQNRVL